MQWEPSVREFVARQRIGHLATSDAQAMPHVVPVCFAEHDGVVYIVIDEKPKTTTYLRRLRNIASNPQAALVLDYYSEDWSRLGWVMLRGRADTLENGDEHRAAIAALRDKYPQYREMALDDRPVIRLTTERVNSWGQLDS
jgi:PPOX class probable F420-dependent enzyme